MTDMTNTIPATPPQATLRGARNLAAVLFGVLIPVVILGEAFFGLAAMQSTVLTQLKTPPGGLTMPAGRIANPSGNDYALFAMTFAESSNRMVIVNKQVLKTSVMEVGLAVVSLGLMVIVLGFETGGGAASGEVGGMKLNLQTASTGVVVFVAGAVMASAGGLMSNEYSTVGTPMFAQVGASGDQSTVETELGYYKECKQSAGRKYKDCFTDQFETLHPEAVK
jgi:hypothetical protein